MTQLLYRIDREKTYALGLPPTVKPRGVAGALVATKRSGGITYRQSLCHYQELLQFFEGYTSRGAAAGSWIGSRAIDTYREYRILYLSEYSSKKTIPDPPRLSGPVQFLEKLLKTWRLQRESAVLLLGQESSYDVEKLLRGYAQLSGRDAKDRIACLFRIRKTLSSLFRDEDAENAWLREPHKLLNGHSPMELLLEGSMENMLTVREYIDFATGR